MDSQDVMAAVAAERRDLAAMLDGLTPQQWRSPSLCQGWRVQEVVAHMTMPFRYSGGRFMWELAKSGGRFNRMSDRCARKDASIGSEKLLESLRQNIEHPWKPPGGGLEGALSHDVIHGLDITVALGMDRQVPHERMRIVFDAMRPKYLTYFGVDLTGIALTATDMDWSIGSGAPLEGTAQNLLLIASGRILPAGSLRGKGSRRFTRSS